MRPFFLVFFHELRGAGHADENVTVFRFEDCTEQHAARLRGFWSAGHAAEVSALGLRIGDFALRFGNLLRLSVDLVLALFEHSKPAIDVGLDATADTGWKDEKDDLSVFAVLLHLELSGPHASASGDPGEILGPLERHAAGFEFPGSVGGVEPEAKSGEQNCVKESLDTPHASVVPARISAVNRPSTWIKFHRCSSTAAGAADEITGGWAERLLFGTFMPGFFSLGHGQFA